MQHSEQPDAADLVSGEMQHSDQPVPNEVQTSEIVEMQHSEQAVPVELQTGELPHINGIILDADQLTTLIHFLQPDLGMQMLSGNDVVAVDMPVSHDVIGPTNATENLSTVNELSMQCESQPITETHARSRKRKRQPGLWIANKRRRMRQAGEEYVSIRGKKIDARRVLPHKDNCKFKCTEKITEANRLEINTNFWKLTEDQKQQYFLMTRKNKARTRLGGRRRTEKCRTKAFSYAYFLYKGEKKERVCKSFYLGTINVSQTRISMCHETKSCTGTPAPSKQGKHVKHKIADEHIEAVREHIRSFPHVASHYRRSNTQKEYIDGSLNISRMYRLFAEKRVSAIEDHDHYNEPVKKNTYSRIFNEEFNIAFNVPKSDRCDICEAFAKLENPASNETEIHGVHVQSKGDTKQTRDDDRKSVTNDACRAVLCFDLQNVILLPRANVSNFYYKRKLSVYNLTGHLATSTSSDAFCCLWHEGLSGRAGNDIGSSLERVLEEVVKLKPHVNNITLWSDSCVPQNKNSLMSTAIIHFLLKHNSITSVTQKFGEPGHSAIQEIDNIHSQIECRLKVTEVYSPVGLVKTPKQVNLKNGLHIMQMRESDFLDYHAVAQQTNLSEIPYSKVKTILYTNGDSVVSVAYGCTFTEALTEVRLHAGRIRRKSPSDAEQLKTLFLSC